MATANGWITIGSKLDTKELEQNIKEAERRLRQFEKEGEQLTKQKVSIQTDITEAETVKQMLEEQIADYEVLAQNGEEVNGIIEEEKQMLETINMGLEAYKSDLDDINSKLEQNKQNQDGITKEIEDQKQELAKTNEEIRKSQALDTGFKSINQTMKGIVKSAVGWGLALFGVRTAMNFLRSAISTMSGYNQQMATDIEYIRFALASTLEPVILRMISLVKTLLFYIGYIANKWFGIDLFAGASVDKFQKGSDALGGMAKSAKEVNKQLAGFDEMTVLQDNTDTGGGGGGGGAGANVPSFDLSQFEGEIPDWLQWIVDHKDEILATLAGIVGFLTAMKLGLGGIKSLGIGLIIAGIVLAVEGLLAYLEDPTWENFGKIIEGIGIAIIGLGILIGSVPAIVIGAIVLIYGIIIKYWDEIKAFLQKGIDWLTGKSDAVHKVFGDTIGNIYDAFMKVLNNMLKGWDNTFKAIKRIFDDVIAIVKAIINGDWKTAWTKAKDIVSTIFNTIVSNIKLAFNSILGVVKSIGSAVGNALWGVIKGAINGILSQVESAVNAPLNAINKALKVINKIPGVNIGSVQTIRVPRLAKGGIINQPGRGVMVGSAIAGEHGREGIIPLTDSQQMALLGEAIGKYITINANITNTMNGRVISRELKTIQNEDDFAFNR